MTTSTFAFYRMPHHTAIHAMRQSGGGEAFADAQDALHAGGGFVIAPFVASDACPALLVRPDEERVLQPDSAEALLRLWCDEALAHAVPDECEGKPTSRDDYHRTFGLFHQQVLSGALTKIVLARQDVVPASACHPVQLFLRACSRYPRMFIALFYAPQSGLWLTATPELLLEHDGVSWHTVALAGTMRYEGNEAVAWSEKNKDEQRIVADYLERLLAQHAEQVERSTAQTVRAGHLMHLRTDFRFHLRQDGAAATLASALHPTPAVCGLPKDHARAFIEEHEQTRRYYSGFVGPWHLSGDSHLFVMLRCMTRCRRGWQLYAGGGIVADSEEEAEWNETEEKLLTMKTLFR